MLSKTRRHKATIAGKATIVGKAGIVGRALIGKTAGNKTAGKWVHGGLERLSYVRAHSQLTANWLTANWLTANWLTANVQAHSQLAGNICPLTAHWQTRVATYLGCCTVFERVFETRGRCFDKFIISLCRYFRYSLFKIVVCRA